MKSVVLPLGEIAEAVDYGFTASAVQHPGGPKLLRITDIQNGAVNWENVPWCETTTGFSRRHRLMAGDIVFARTGATTGKSFFIRECPSDAIFASYLIRVRIGARADPLYISHYFQSPEYWAQVNSSARGAAQPGINASVLKRITVPLPPLAEQRRIAELLDQADRLRAKRRVALTQLDALIESIFIDMFGDVGLNDRSWPTACLQELLSMPLRNGVSPSYGASVQACVLTLSAITGVAFDPLARKVATFRNPPRRNQLVDERDLLICRGNGNLGLVGKGHFPTVAMKDVIFPDTMIAARVASTRADAAFLEHLWNSDAVRTQVQGLARTTNGTFKVNQAMLGGITVVVPPLSLQRDFANRGRVIAHTRAAFHAWLTRLDALVASLQYRAFRGEL